MEQARTADAHEVTVYECTFDDKPHQKAFLEYLNQQRPICRERRLATFYPDERPLDVDRDEALPPEPGDGTEE